MRLSSECGPEVRWVAPGEIIYCDEYEDLMGYFGECMMKAWEMVLKLIDDDKTPSPPLRRCRFRKKSRGNSVTAILWSVSCIDKYLTPSNVAEDLGRYLMHQFLSMSAASFS